MKKTIEINARYLQDRFVFQDGTADRCVIANAQADGRYIVIKGECQKDNLQSGVMYRFDGEWKNHPLRN